MKSGYKCSAKRIAAIGVMLCMLVLTCLTVTSVLNTKAEESIGQGHVNYDVTDLRIRTSPVSGSVITKVDGGFKFDIYEEVDTSSGLWYGIGFYLNGDYYRGYVTSEYVTVDKRNDYEPDADFEEYLDSQGFPDSYKEGLRQLHAQYPNWVFVADHNGTDWNTMVEKQNVKTRSLVHKDGNLQQMVAITGKPVSGILLIVVDMYRLQVSWYSMYLIQEISLMIHIYLCLRHCHMIHLFRI